MLDQSDADYVRRHFWVYEHNWSHYASFLGEPFLLEDALVYFDGKVLYISSFPVGSPLGGLGDQSLVKIISNPRFIGASVVDVWGTYDRSGALAATAGRLEEVSFTPPGQNGEATLNLREFDYANDRSARIALKKASQRGHSHIVTHRESLTLSHMSVMENWASRVEVPTLVRWATLSLARTVGKPDVFLAESYVDDILVGFSVFQIVNQAKAVNYGLCIERGNGLRAGDDLMAAMVEFLMSSSVVTLHLGYSSTPSLLRFKLKWGASATGPSWAESFFCCSEGFRERIVDGSFVFSDRIREPLHVSGSWASRT